MILISEDAYLAIDETTLNHPVAGIDTLLTTSNIAAGSAATGFPASNLANPATYLYWRASSSAAQTLTITLTGNTQQVDYVGLAKHNFYSKGVTVKVTGKLFGGSHADLIAEFMPGDDGPMLLRFAAGAYVEIKVVLGAGSAAAQLAVLYCGTLMTFERKLYVGHRPITINSNSEVVSGLSESGNFLGRITVNETRSTSINMQNLTPTWVRNTLKPFLINAKERPFFFAWRPETYPEEVGFVWFKAEVMPDNARGNGMMQFSADVMGIV